MNEDANELNGAPVDTSGGDLDVLDSTPADEGRDMEVRNKLGEVIRHADGRPFTITVLGSESKLFRDLVQKQNDRRSESFFRTRRPVASSIVQRDNRELLLRMIKKWDIAFQGKAVPSNEKGYRLVLENEKIGPEILRQIDDFVGNVANFMKG